MTAASILVLLGGLTILTVGAEALVRAASDIARAAGIAPLVVGLTVVAFGTSAPEIAVSVRAAMTGQGTVALGNVVGSNVLNVLVILGLSAAIRPVIVRRQLVRRDVPFLIFASVVALVFALNRTIGLVEGVALIALGIGYTAYLARLGVAESSVLNGEPTDPHPKPTVRVWVFSIALGAFGLTALILGANLFLDGAITVARSFGVSELVIGLTLIAAGTSLPELATTIVAAVRGHRDIAIGNVVGSNIFNILIVLGAAATAAPDGLPIPAGALTFDLPIMLLVSVVCLPIFRTDFAVTRWEGFLFLGYYVAYLVYLFLDSSGHDARNLFGAAVLYFALPLTAALLVGMWWRGRHPAPDTT